MTSCIHGSIGRRLAIIVMLSVLPALTILLYNGMGQRRQSIEVAKNEVQLLVHSMAETQAGFSRTTRQILSAMSQMPDIQRLNGSACNVFFREVVNRSPEYIGITLTDAKGEVIASNRPFSKVNLADRKHLRDALTTRDFAVGEFIASRVGSSQPSFAYAYPVLDKEGKVLGVLTAILSLDYFSGMFDLTSLPGDSFVALTDHKGNRLYYYPPKPETNPIGKPIRPENWTEALKVSGPGQFINKGSDGKNRIFAFEPISIKPSDPPYIYVWAGIAEDPVIKPANDAMVRSLGLLFLSTILALVISWVIGKTTLVSPIRDLVATTRKFAAGKLDIRSEFAGMPNELGTLAQAFNDMATSLAQSQQRLQEKELHLEEAQRIGHIGSWEWDAESGIAVLSKQFWLIMGANEPGTTPSLSVLEKFLLPASMTKLHSAMEATMQSGTPFETELEGRLENGEERVVLARGEVRPDKAGMVKGLRGTFLDITERKRVEDERANLQIQLVQAQKMESIGRLAGGVAHDFNNMLAVILGHTELAQVKLEPGHPLHDELQVIGKAARRSADLTKQLLAYARKQTVTPKILNLNETVESMLMMLRRLIGENIELVWQPSALLWPVRMDPTQLDQVLANICVNAKDAIAEKGTITLHTENVHLAADFCATHPDCSPGEYVLLSVSDTGCGMDREILENLFEPFFTTKELGKGTGLGLATVYGIIRQNEGFILVESEIGRGTTFKVFLPRNTGNVASVEAKLTHEVPHGNGETILLVEDEPMVMSLGKEQLTSLNYTVITATTPHEAIRLAKDHAGIIDLLITDVVMPEMNGGDLADKLLAGNPALKLLFMSGYPAEVIAMQGILREGVLLLEKPFSKNELAKKAHMALKGI